MPDPDPIHAARRPGSAAARLQTRLRVAAVVLAALLAVAYAIRADAHGRLVNTDFQAYDQTAYYHFAEKIVKTGGAYLTDGARGPAYPWLLAPFVDPDAEEAAFFAFGKRLNIAVSLACLAVVGIVLFRSLPWPSALGVFLAAAFTVYIFKAAYVQPELLYYTAFFAAFVQLDRLLRSPSARRAVAAGAVLGLAHLLKPSALPMLAIYAVCAGVAAFRRRRAGAGDRPGPSRAVWLAPCLVVASFAGVVAPYAVANQRVFGDPLYNVNSTFYMWYDGWDEVVAGTKAHGDRKGWPDMPAEDLPSVGRYLREHDTGQIVRRLADGLVEIEATARASYGWYRYALAYGIVALLAAFARRSSTWAAARTDDDRPAWPRAAFAAATFAAYLSLYAWFGPINYGPRFVLALFLPWLYVTASVAARSPLATWRWAAGGTWPRPSWRNLSPPRTEPLVTQWSLLDVVNVLFLVHLAGDIAAVLIERIVAMPAGA